MDHLAPSKKQKTTHETTNANTNVNDNANDLVAPPLHFIPIALKPSGGLPISWDMYFMQVAKLATWRSKDPHTGVGAVIVDPLNRIVGTGYNGFPRGCDDDEFSWDKVKKHLYVVHAEQNAILNSNRGSNLTDCRLYTTKFPCHECAKIIIQSGIKEIITLDKNPKDSESYRAAVAMFSASEVIVKVAKFGFMNPVQAS